eukprot:6027776-Amphidinium_carterae.1
MRLDNTVFQEANHLEMRLIPLRSRTQDSQGTRRQTCLEDECSMGAMPELAASLLQNLQQKQPAKTKALASEILCVWLHLQSSDLSHLRYYRSSRSGGVPNCRSLEMCAWGPKDCMSCLWADSRETGCVAQGVLWWCREADKLFDELDVNSDGQLSKEEFQRYQKFEARDLHLSTAPPLCLL